MTNPETDFDGCNRECRKAGAHTLRWGGCEHAPKPEPTVSISRVYTDPADGCPSIGFDTYTVAQLGELITAGLRASDLPVNGDDLVDIGLVAAQAIVHRNDGPAPAAVSVPPPAPRADVLREAADRYEEILANANTGQDPRYWTAVRDITLGLRAMAAEAQQPEPEATATLRRTRSTVKCSRAVLRQPHAPHGWQPQPGMDFIHCPGASGWECPLDGDLQPVGPCVAGEQQNETPEAEALRCVCGDPVQLMDETDPTSWIHSPGSDTRCLEARPRCPHCQMPHDLTPGSLPVATCAGIRHRIAEAERSHAEGDHNLCCRRDCEVLRQS